MTTLSVKQLFRKQGIIRPTMQAGDEIELLFHKTTIGYLVPKQTLEEERAELARLRQIVADRGLDEGQENAPAA
jgi:hypothetical protein